MCLFQIVKTFENEQEICCLAILPPDMATAIKTITFSIPEMLVATTDPCYWFWQASFARRKGGMGWLWPHPEKLQPNPEKIVFSKKFSLHFLDLFLA